MPAAAFEQTCTRIASALQILVAEESLALRVGDLAAVDELQRRAAPLVDFLAAHPSPAGQAHAVIAALRAERKQSSDRVEAAMARLRDELCALEFSRRRLDRMGSAYTLPSGTPSRLCTVG